MLMTKSNNVLRRPLCAAWLALAIAGHAEAHGDPAAASAVSTLSALPIAMSVAAPEVLLVSGGAVLAVVAVTASAEATVLIVERASDGARASVRLSAEAAAGLSIAAGTVVTVTAISAGWVLSAAGQAIAFIPNQIGAALLYNERITR
ncbi:MAG TPA: hypothetical protein VIO33_11710 [Burkholderiaceae bacterium]